jgi:hypothetical protein
LSSIRDWFDLKMPLDREPSMAITPLNSFADVQDFLDQILSDNNESAALSFAPHKVFWRNLTYDQFVNGNVPGVTDPATNLPMPVLVKGNSASSNLIMALQGIGAAFGPDSVIGQMPANGPPFFTVDQIASIVAWIDNGCPQ